MTQQGEPTTVVSPMSNSYWVPATCVENPALGSWLWHLPALAILSSWGVNQRVKDLYLLCITLPLKCIK